MVGVLSEGIKGRALGRVGVLWCVNKQSRRCECLTNVVWSYVLARYYGFGVVQMAVATVGWLYDRVARGEPWWYTGRLVSSQYRWYEAMRLYSADYKATGVQQEE